MKGIPLALSLALIGLSPAHATSLQVMPVLLEVPAAARATTVTVNNIGAEPVTVQLRVFRWAQSGGQETLEPATEVVASPPVVTLRPRQDYTVRIVRVGAVVVD